MMGHIRHGCCDLLWAVAPAVTQCSVLCFLAIPRLMESNFRVIQPNTEYYLRKLGSTTTRTRGVVVEAIVEPSTDFSDDPAAQFLALSSSGHEPCSRVSYIMISIASQIVLLGIQTNLQMLRDVIFHLLSSLHLVELLPVG